MEGLQKKSLDNSSLERDPSIDRKHLLFDETDNNDKTWMSKGGRTNAACLQKVAVTENWLSHRHAEPYRRILWCRSQAIHALQLLGPHAVSHGRIGVRTQHCLFPPAYCFKPPASPQENEMGDKISKNPCHPSINASHHTTERRYSINNIRKLCERSVSIIRCRSITNNS